MERRIFVCRRALPPLPLLPLLQVDVSQGPVVLSCEEPITAFAPTAAQELQADAPAPPP